MLPTLSKGMGRFFAPRPMRDFRNEIDDLFHRFFERSFLPFNGEEEVRTWDLNFEDKDSEIFVRGEVPGFEPNEIDIEVKNGVLTIEAEKKEKKGEEETFRHYRRTLALPCGIKEEKATAIYRNGVLELHLPKVEASKPKKVLVKAE
jgi:HSP20 family protein